MIRKMTLASSCFVTHASIFFRSGSAQPQARVARTPYVCPLPDEVDPPLKMSA
jgi:hypothetical protein